MEIETLVDSVLGVFATTIAGLIVTTFWDYLNWYYKLGICILVFMLVIWWIIFRRNRRSSPRTPTHEPLISGDDNGNGGGGGGGGSGGGGDAGDPKRFYYQASALTIEHRDAIVNNKRCWRSVRDDRFTEVWELLQVWFLYIEARINLMNLSPQTEYAAYLIFKLKDDSKGLNGAYLDASISLDNTLQENVVCLTPNTVEVSSNNLIRFPVERSDGDGWMEVKLGQFYCDESTNREAVASLQKTTEREMSGLIVAGVDVRPI